jgi:hypothetical protein
MLVSTAFESKIPRTIIEEFTIFLMKCMYIVDLAGKCKVQGSTGPSVEDWAWNLAQRAEESCFGSLSYVN